MKVLDIEGLRHLWDEIKKYINDQGFVVEGQVEINEISDETIEEIVDFDLIDGDEVSY